MRAKTRNPRLQHEKFEACVLPLEETAGSIIELARGSASNSRIVIFGLGGTAQDAMRYSKLCINAIFHEPLERSAAMKLVRSTRMLVLHEFRRYVRIPVMTEVGIVMADGHQHDRHQPGDQLRRDVAQGPSRAGTRFTGRE